ncbi:hyaluronoglucosaminidase [Necator americanus]|uniref:Hyaluronidase n=1 Tax=Necator americanus TaxID=51031 RepID=W2TQD2_NECAM|nr:hyaluronoglucosaminidase [Necator americanus]ETN84018.1 hyaluronoglucosaminidase [Necator americanus]
MQSSIFVLLLLGLPTMLNAFRAVWNFFDKACVGKKNYVEFDKYNIETNKDHQFWGEKVAIFYEFNFGKYPYYKDYNKSIPINGGLPQKSDLAAHLQVVETNITDKIKDQNSTGLGIIDLEEWRPLFSENGYNKKRAILTEARRISHMFSPPLPIYAYIKIEYDPLNKHDDFYSNEDLCTTIKKPADMGIDGIIFWSSSKDITQRCDLIKGKMDTSVGP